MNLICVQTTRGAKLGGRWQGQLSSNAPGRKRHNNRRHLRRTFSVRRDDADEVKKGNNRGLGSRKGGYLDTTEKRGDERHLNRKRAGIGCGKIGIYRSPQQYKATETKQRGGRNRRLNHICKTIWPRKEKRVLTRIERKHVKLFKRIRTPARPLNLRRSPQRTKRRETERNYSKKEQRGETGKSELVRTEPTG